MDSGFVYFASMAGAQIGYHLWQKWIRSQGEPGEIQLLKTDSPWSSVRATKHAFLIVRIWTDKEGSWDGHFFSLFDEICLDLRGIVQYQKNSNSPKKINF
jgi:hypothetical protein